MSIFEFGPAPTRHQRHLGGPARFGFGGALATMGVLHFARAKDFESIVPRQLPGTARFYNYASGVWEIATGAMLVNPTTRRAGGLSAAALMLAVWPANFYHCFTDLSGGSGARKWAYHLTRLPMQVPLISYGWSIWKGER